MIWPEVIEKYGKWMADRMAKSPFLDGITVTMRDGQMDIPAEDIERAYQWAKGRKIIGWD
jgi:hypothetical protein